MIAIDDTLLFHRDAKHGRSTLQKLDESFQANGVPRNQAMDVTLQTCMTGLGCDKASQPPNGAARKFKAVSTSAWLV